MNRTEINHKENNQIKSRAEHPKIKIIVVCGPTAIGKTGAAIKLAQKFGGEIISADSMQIYKYMDIGTAKPSPEEQQAAFHHLIDVAEPDEDFDAARFARLAGRAVESLHNRGIVPIVAGGTGLYIKALTQGIFESPPVDEQVRKQLKAACERVGSRELHKRLEVCDPETAARLHPNDAFRIIRALEVFESTGVPISRHHRSHQFEDAPYDVLKIELIMDREALYDRINRRVDIMLDEGLLHEVKELLEKGYPGRLKSMQSIGYRHMVHFIEGKSDWNEAVRTLKRDTRRYAKRQFTWFGADAEMIRVEPENIENITPLIKNFLQGM